MRFRWLYLFKIAMITILATYGCTIYQKPRPIFDVPFQERSQSKINGEVRVTVAVLSAEESRQLFGVNLDGQDIQPVWVRVQNADTVPYWLFCPQVLIRIISHRWNLPMHSILYFRVL